MNKRSFLKNLPFLVGIGITAPSVLLTNQSKLPIGYISPKAKELRKKVDEVRQPDSKLSNQLLDELLDNCNPTPKQFDEMYDRCAITGEALYRLSTDGFKNKG